MTECTITHNIEGFQGGGEYVCKSGRCSDKKEEGLLLKEKVVTTEHFIYC